MAMLRARRAEVAAALERIDEAKQRARRLADDEAELLRERERLARALEGAPASRHLPLLSSIRIASPCDVSWKEMIGDERSRHCGSCRREVFNLTALTPDEAERFLEERLGEDLCVRLYRRRDRTVLVGRDCRRGAARRTVAVVASGLTLVLSGLALVAMRGNPRVECDAATGSAVPWTDVVGRVTGTDLCEPAVGPSTQLRREAIMGGISVEAVKGRVRVPEVGQASPPDRPRGLYVEGAPPLPGRPPTPKRADR